MSRGANVISTTESVRTAVVVEDDPEIRDILAGVFESAGFTTVTTGNGFDGVRAVEDHQPLITTLDINMPGIDGFEAARRIRARSSTYIIMLTGMQDETDVVLGLGAGADEYLAKPFRPRELRARIDAILRRHGHPLPLHPSPSAVQVPADSDTIGSPAVGAPHPLPDPPESAKRVSSEAGAGTSLLQHRDLRVDPDTRVVLLGASEMMLTRTEFDLLTTLLRSKRRVRSKADLTVALRGESHVTSYSVGEADKRAVEAHMANLRRKLGDDPAHPRYIETVRGVGYRMTSEPLSS